MTSILMVCLGNICRSPLAHGVLHSKLNNDSLFFVDSAGTAAYHTGNKPDYRSIQVAKKNGLDISKQTARQFKVSDFDWFDYIYAMDESNYKNIMTLARTDADRRKVKLFLEMNITVADKNLPDPYYGEFNEFEAIYQLIDTTCIEIVKMLKG